MNRLFFILKNIAMSSFVAWFMTYIVKSNSSFNENMLLSLSIFALTEIYNIKESLNK